MHPVLFEIFGHPVPTYGVMVSLAHLVGIAAVLAIARARRLPVEPYVDLIFVVLLAGLLGARAAYVWEHRAQFTSPAEWFYLTKGGLSFFGGLALAFPAYLCFLLLRKMPVWETADLFAPVLPLSLAIVRLGCFAAGCCHGVACNLPWALRFDSPLVEPPWAGRLLHPTQLYESAFLFALSAGLFFWSARGRPRPGAVACVFLLAYATYRLLTNHLRGDLGAGPAGFSSYAQLAAALLFVLAAGTLAWRVRLPRFRQ